MLTQHELQFMLIRVVAIFPYAYCANLLTQATSLLSAQSSICTFCESCGSTGLQLLLDIPLLWLHRYEMPSTAFEPNCSGSPAP